MIRFRRINDPQHQDHWVCLNCFYDAIDNALTLKTPKKK